MGSTSFQLVNMYHYALPRKLGFSRKLKKKNKTHGRGGGGKRKVKRGGTGRGGDRLDSKNKRVRGMLFQRDSVTVIQKIFRSFSFNLNSP